MFSSLNLFSSKSRKKIAVARLFSDVSLINKHCEDIVFLFPAHHATVHNLAKPDVVRDVYRYLDCPSFAMERKNGCKHIYIAGKQRHQSAKRIRELLSNYGEFVTFQEKHYEYIVAWIIKHVKLKDVTPKEINYINGLFRRAAPESLPERVKARGAAPQYVSLEEQHDSIFDDASTADDVLCTENIREQSVVGCQESSEKEETFDKSLFNGKKNRVLAEKPLDIRLGSCYHCRTYGSALKRVPRTPVDNNNSNYIYKYLSTCGKDLRFSPWRNTYVTVNAQGIERPIFLYRKRFHAPKHEYEQPIIVLYAMLAADQQAIRAKFHSTTNLGLETPTLTLSNFLYHTPTPQIHPRGGERKKEFKSKIFDFTPTLEQFSAIKPLTHETFAGLSKFISENIDGGIVFREDSWLTSQRISISKDFEQFNDWRRKKRQDPRGSGKVPPTLLNEEEPSDIVVLKEILIRTAIEYVRSSGELLPLLQAVPVVDWLAHVISNGFSRLNRHGNLTHYLKHHRWQKIMRIWMVCLPKLVREFLDLCAAGGLVDKNVGELVSTNRSKSLYGFIDRVLGITIAPKFSETEKENADGTVTTTLLKLSKNMINALMAVARLKRVEQRCAPQTAPPGETNDLYRANIYWSTAIRGT